MGAASGCLRRRIASSRISSTTSSGISCASTTIGSSAIASAARRRENQAESSDRNSASATGASTTRAPGSSPAFSAVYSDDNELIEQVKSDSWNNEQVHGGDIWGVIAQEGEPTLAWRPAAL